MKQRLTSFLIILLTLCCCNFYAQKPTDAKAMAGKQGQAKIDSLLKELPKQKEDTNKVKLLNILSSGYWKINTDEGIKYGQQSLELATKLNWEKGIADNYNALGVNFLYKSDYPTALDYYQKALKIDEKIGNKNGIAGVTCNIGIIYNRLGEYEKALDYYFKALKIDEETGNKKFTANVIGNIGSIYNNLKDYPRALDYTFKQIKIDEEIGDKIGKANALGNIGTVYYRQDDYPNALEYYFKALKMDEEMGLKYSISNMYECIGNVYTVQKNYTVSIDYLLKALKIQEETHDKSGMASDLTNIGIAYLFLVKDSLAKSSKITSYNEIAGNKPEPTITIPNSRKARLHNAVDFLQRGLAISKELQSLSLMQNAYENLEQAYKLTGDYKLSVECADNYREIKDSVFSKENNDKIIRMGVENEFESRRKLDNLKADVQLQRQKSYTYIGVACILLLAGFSFFIVKERGKSEKERKKSDELLLNILPGEVAKELKITGTTKARHFDNITVLFTDFVNFTNSSERMNAEALIDELQTCFKKFDEITEKYHVEKIKTIGDAYLAVAGMPSPDPQHAEHVVRAAIEINSFMQDRLAKLGNSTFEIRIGIHTGSVVAGIVGMKKFAYDIWGDAVNTAARMEQSSESGKINISQTTYELVKDKFTCKYRGEINAKNKGMLKMYYVND